jgi:NHLM bacteriocin system ABC transporter peptidase/ATP-binding protein
MRKWLQGSARSVVRSTREWLGLSSDRRFRTPTVLQMEAVECGAASLSMILGYYGRFVPLEELRYACGVTRDGSKASNMLKAARSFGLLGKGFKMEPQQLRVLRQPVIVFWNFNHFIVVEGFADERVFINDPATGPRVVSSLEFDESFTGVVLALQPGADFAPGGIRPGVMTSLKSRMPGLARPLSYLLAISLALLIPGLLLPAFSLVFIDYYLVQRLADWLWPLLGAMAATAVVRVILTFMLHRHLLRLQSRLSGSWSGLFLWHVLRLPVAFFGQRYAGEIAWRVSMNDHVVSLLTGTLANAVLSLFSMAIFAFLMLQYDVLLTLLAVSFSAINLLVLTISVRHLADVNQRLLMNQAKLSGVATQSIYIIDSFKAGGMEDLFFMRLVAYHAKVISAEQDLGRARLLLGSAPVLLGGVATAALLTFGGMRVMDGALSVGMLIAFQMMSAQFEAPVATLMGLSAEMQDAQGSVARLDDVLRHPQDRRLESVDVAGSIAKLSGRIELRDLSFGFSPLDPPLIDGLSLTLEPGARLALVGGSGSGKSTLGKLIAGIYQPTRGVLLLDGVDCDKIPRDALASSLAFVDQELALFEGSVRDNISLWDETLPEEDIVRAGKDAALHDFVAARHNGYDSGVDEGGRNFSGGQRQRIEIARALAVNPSILILDEATSALDTASELQVMNNVRRRGCTCIIIAHRLSTIRDCDMILVLEQGRVVQRGTHDSMMAEDGPYRRLIET